MAEASVNFGAVSVWGLLRYLDSDSLSRDSSPEETLGLKVDAAVSPTPSCEVFLSLEILQPELKKRVYSEPGTEEEGNGAII